ncbi:MAG: hypothetical protein C4576_18040 [Desulfobacteraceae bacterium]|nr:MAG: hypothetical protein C4576_18040 [Desulfobacteraceae bacterium]
MRRGNRELRATGNGTSQEESNTKKEFAADVKIRLTTNFSFQTGGGGEYQVPGSVRTVADLLSDIGGQIDFVFMDGARKDLRKDIELNLNGKAIWFYPEGLRTELKEDDFIDITLTPLGGG